jgi:formylglycine-generating enzyme required for sulfatase activity
MTQIFISYSRKDIAFIEQLSIDLKTAGLEAWYDLTGLEGGAHWSREIEKAIKASEYVIMVLSPDSVSSSWVEEEILYARKLKRKIIPLLYRDCELPFGFHILNFIDVRESKYRQNYKEILRALDIKFSEREAAETATREKILKEAAEKSTREETENEFVEKTQLKVEELKRQNFVKEKSEREAVEKTKRESVQSQSGEKISTSSRTVGKFAFGAIGVFGAIAVCVTGFLVVFSLMNSPGGNAVPINTEPTLDNSVPTNLVPTLENSISVNTESAPTSPVTSSTEILDAKGVLMELVPAGEFIMGSNAKDALAECRKYYSMCQIDNFRDEEPLSKIYLDTFYIDKFEVTNVLYKTCVDMGECEVPNNVSSRTRPNYYGNPEFDNYPVIYINWNMAKTYCDWRGARLPTEAEWEKSARGADGRTYPWGEDIDCDKANYGGLCKDDTTSVGSYESGKSIYGVYDMAGNVMEWVNSLYWPYPYKASGGRENLYDSGKRVLRGGSWDFVGYLARSSARSTYNSDLFDTSNLGFRCATSAP